MNSSSTILADFARRFSDLEEQNSQLKQQLRVEQDEHASTKGMLRQMQADPDRNRIGEASLVPHNPEMAVFAEKSIAFCDQMRAFATHILQQQQQQCAQLSNAEWESSCAVNSSPDKIDDEDVPTSARDDDHHQHRDDAPGSSGGGQSPPAKASSGGSRFDPECKRTRAQLHQLSRELKDLLQEHSNRIDVGSLPRLYERRFRRIIAAFADLSLTDVISSLPGGNITLEQNDLGTFVVLKDRGSLRNDSRLQQSRSEQGRHRRSRSRSPRAHRHASRHRSRSFERAVNRVPFSATKERAVVVEEGNQGGTRPARSYYRYARSPEGALVCIYFNSRSCPNKPCSYAHICGRCGKSSHGIKTCPVREDVISEVAAVEMPTTT